MNESQAWMSGFVVAIAMWRNNENPGERITKSGIEEAFFLAQRGCSLTIGKHEAPEVSTIKITTAAVREMEQA